MKPGFALLAAVVFVLTALITLNLKHAGENDIMAESHVLSYMSKTQFQDGASGEPSAAGSRCRMSACRSLLHASGKAHTWPTP
jgi:hypothetical protein